jgi:hypothetical protein
MSRTNSSLQDDLPAEYIRGQHQQNSQNSVIFDLRVFFRNVRSQ